MRLLACLACVVVKPVGVPCVAQPSSVTQIGVFLSLALIMIFRVPVIVVSASVGRVA